MEITNAEAIHLDPTLLFCSCYPVREATYITRYYDQMARTFSCIRCGLTWTIEMLLDAQIQQGKVRFHLVFEANGSQQWSSGVE